MRKGSKHSEETKRKISSSMLDNTNAEKWTEEFVVSTLEEMIRYADINKCSLKLTILLEFKIYNRDWFSDMKDKFINHETVPRLINAIGMICEHNTYDGAYSGMKNATMAKLALASHYEWTTERTKNETKVQGTEDVDLSKLSTEELLKMREDIRKNTKPRPGDREED